VADGSHETARLGHGPSAGSASGQPARPFAGGTTARDLFCADRWQALHRRRRRAGGGARVVVGVAAAVDSQISWNDAGDAGGISMGSPAQEMSR
jgi:hypothetical protein